MSDIRVLREEHSISFSAPYYKANVEVDIFLHPVRFLYGDGVVIGKARLVPITALPIINEIGYNIEMIFILIVSHIGALVVTLIMVPVGV